MRIPMNRAEAERLTDKAIRRRFPRPAIGLAVLLLAIIVALSSLVLQAPILAPRYLGPARRPSGVKLRKAKGKLK
jgi:hypothetical protein